MGIDALDNRDPFSVSLLNGFRCFAFSRVGYYHAGGDNTYHETSLVEIVNIGVVHAILGDDVPYKPKPRA